MPRTVVLSIALALLALTTTAGAAVWLLADSASKGPAVSAPMSSPQKIYGVVAIRHGPLYTPVPRAIVTPKPTPRPPTPVPTPLAAPAPAPQPPPPPPPPPTPEPTPEPAPILEPAPAPTIPPVSPDFVLSKEAFLSGRLYIERIGVVADFEERGMDENGVMQDPSGPDRVGWYNFMSLPNEGKNVFLAGHVSFGGAPAVFSKLGELEPGDQVVIWAGGVAFQYSIVSKELRSKEDSLPAVTDPVDSEVITLMTCAGNYIPEAGDYSHRWIVRGVRVN